jgi:hypothetical protein
MLKFIVVLCLQGFIAGLLIYLIKRSAKQDKALNDHMIVFTEKITERPDFTHMDLRIERVIKPVCKNIDSLTIALQGHTHDKEHGAVIFRV